MRFEVERIDIGTRTPTVILHRRDAEELGANPLDRILIRQDDRTVTGIVEVTDGLVEEGHLGATEQLAALPDTVDVELAPKPDSVYHIREKLEGDELEREDVREIVRDIDRNRLSDVELGAYVSAIYANGLSMGETIDLTEAMTECGETLEWNAEIVADKHSIGGVAGNRVTPIVVPIVVAAGVTIPKTSSRAITSPAGTADTMEVFCDVEFTREEVEAIVDDVGGCMVWGGSIDISPVDDKIVRAEHPLSLDPEGQIIASVLSKKKSAGSTHVVVDVPYGEGSKVQDIAEARELARDFKRVGEHLDIRIECTITRGSQPIGRGIGPALEARDVLRVLEGEGPRDLRLKSVRLADILLEICGVEANAATILDGGRAHDAFRSIVAAQGGDPDVTVDEIAVGELSEVREAGRGGIVSHIDNGVVSEAARRAGAPKDAGAGIAFHRKVGDDVEGAGTPLFTVHAEKDEKLADAAGFLDRHRAVRVLSEEEALVERV